MLQKLFRLSLFQLSGILGVGIFYLPYLFYSSNLYFALAGLLVATYLTYKVNTSYIKIITHFDTTHQLSGYAQKLLGPKAKTLSALNMFILSLGALLALTSMTQKFLAYIFPSVSPLLLGLGLLILLTILSLAKSKILTNFFQLLPILFLIVPLILVANSLKANFLPPLAPSSYNLNFFGWTMFALSGFTVLPEMWTMLNKRLNSIKVLRKSSFLGLILAALTYAIFVFHILFSYFL
jgi:amino acid transporter